MDAVQYSTVGAVNPLATCRVSVSPPHTPSSHKLNAFLDLRWPIMISFANSSRLGILHTGTLCGSRVHRSRMTLSKSATSVTYTGGDSTVFSMLFFPRKINPTYQSIMNNLLPKVQIISSKVLLVPTITFRPELAWNVNQTFMPLGNCEFLSRLWLLIFSQPR